MTREHNFISTLSVFLQTVAAELQIYHQKNPTQIAQLIFNTIQQLDDLQVNYLRNGSAYIMRRVSFNSYLYDVHLLRDSTPKKVVEEDEIEDFDDDEKPGFSPENPSPFVTSVANSSQSPNQVSTSSSQSKSAFSPLSPPNYPGLVSGATKSFKKGILHFIITEDLLKSGSITCSSKMKSYLSLRQKSQANTDFFQTYNPRKPLPPQFLIAGFHPAHTKILRVPPKTPDKPPKYKLMIEDLGHPLNFLDFAVKTSEFDGEYQKIVNALYEAGQCNPLRSPYDVKPENILVKGDPEQDTSSYVCIDFSIPEVTPLYLRPYAKNKANMMRAEGLGFKNIIALAHHAAITQQANLDSPIPTKNYLSLREIMNWFVASAIISTFICISASRSIKEIETLARRQNIFASKIINFNFPSILSSVQTELSMLSSYFEQWPDDFKRVFSESLTHELSNPDKNDWINLLMKTFQLS